MRHKIKKLLPLAIILYVFIVSSGCSLPTAQASSLKQSARKSPRTSVVTVTTTSLQSATAKVSYSAALAASGGSVPYTWKLTSGVLPAGITLSPAGVLSGTPTTGGTSTFSVQAADSSTPAVRGSATLTLSVATSSASALAISTSALPGGTVNTSYSTDLGASGGTLPYTWSVTAGQLPTGLMLTSRRSLLGTPTASGVFSFTAQVVDSTSTAQKATKAFSITIAAATPSAPPLIISTSSVPSGTVNTSYSTVGRIGWHGAVYLERHCGTATGWLDVNVSRIAPRNSHSLWYVQLHGPGG